MREAIADAAFRHHEEVLAGEREVVGVNVLREDDEQPIEIHRIDPRIEADQVARLRALRAARDGGGGRGAAGRRARRRPRRPATCCRPMREALRARATVGEVCGVLRAEFGEYDRVRAADRREHARTSASACGRCARRRCTPAPRRPSSASTRAAS